MAVLKRIAILFLAQILFMNTKNNRINYSASNSYSTLNDLTEETKNIWLVFHGLGYLSRYFIAYFKYLNPKENYIIAPQAPSKYYQDKSFKNIGACWLTREDTQEEINNILNYIDAIYEKEIAGKNKNLILMGYSQGVSIATRWLAHKKASISKLIIHSGSVPKELKASDFDFLDKNIPILYLYGINDPYIKDDLIEKETAFSKKIFGNRYKIKTFDGVHEVHIDSLIEISK